MSELKLASQVRDIASAMTGLGESWVMVGDMAKRGFGVAMRSRDGEIVNFQPDGGGRDRLVIEGIDPATAYLTGTPITVGAARTPAAIAREIKNRLLPDYREALARRRADQEVKRGEFTARAAAVNAAEELFGARTDFGEFEPTAAGEVTYLTTARLPLAGVRTQRIYGRPYTFSEFARVDVTGDATLMSLSLRDLPTEVVMRMLAVLAEHSDKADS